MARIAVVACLALMLLAAPAGAAARVLGLPSAVRLLVVLARLLSLAAPRRRRSRAGGRRPGA